MICDNCIHDSVCGLEGHLDDALTFCADKVTNAQPIRRGQWILKSEKIVDVEVKLPTECSVCGFSEFKAEKYNYCPNCGRDMRAE